MVVLGGGRGSRLHPLTRDRCKAAVAFGGKYRLIDICISNCRRSKLDRIFILTQFNSFSLNRHVWQAYAGELQGRGFVDIIATEPTRESGEEAQGTGEALRQALKYVMHHRPRYVLVVSGDHLYSMDYRRMLLCHEIQEAEITLAAQYIPHGALPDRTLVRVDAEGRVLDLYDRPRRTEKVESFRLDREGPARYPDGRPYLALMGAAVFNAEVMASLLSGRHESYGRTILPRAVEKHRTLVYGHEGYWEDVGTIEAFYRANMDWRAGHGLAEEFGESLAPITHSRRLPPARIDGSLIEDSVVCDGSVIRAGRISRSVVGIRSRIGEETIIEDAILLGNDDTGDGPMSEIGKNCCIRRAIVDKNVRIGDNCRIVNQDETREGERHGCFIRSGIVVVPRGTVIPPNTVI